MWVRQAVARLLKTRKSLIIYIVWHAGGPSLSFEHCACVLNVLYCVFGAISAGTCVIGSVRNVYCLFWGVYVSCLDLPPPAAFSAGGG